MSADRTRSTAPSPIAFAGATLDRAAHLRDDIDRLRERDTSRAVLVSPERGISITEGRTLSLLPVAALPADVPLTFLGLDPSGAAMFGFDTLYHGAPDHQTFASLRTLAAELDPAEAALAAYAVGMVNWHRVTEYCGRSGHATEVEAGG